jgi:hypothetical protein
MKFHRLAVIGACGMGCLCAQMEQRASQENVAASGRQGREVASPPGQAMARGILIDASCRDRTSLNLREPPETQQAEAPVEPPAAAHNNPPKTGPVSAKGIAVDAATIKAERGSVMENQVPELYERQSDPTCAITGSTTAFALLMDDGRLLDLDEGGNTLALEALQASSAGRAMLNGHGPGVKPRVVVKGRIRDDRLIALDVTPAR